jgi:outer membrane lipoprotein-sorting protein
VKAFVALCLMVGVADAQPAVTPAQALAKVEATYQKPVQLTATFEQQVTNAISGRAAPSTGTLWVAKPAKSGGSPSLRFDYVGKKRPVDKQFLFDGTTLAYIDHGNYEVTSQPATGSQLPALVAFFTGAGSLSSQFTVAAPTTKNQLVPGAVVLELTPKQPNAAYSQLFLVIDPKSWTVTRTTVIDSSGNTNTFTFSRLDTTKVVPASWFKPDPKTTAGYRTKR